MTTVTQRAPAHNMNQPPAITRSDYAINGGDSRVGVQRPVRSVLPEPAVQSDLAQGTMPRTTSGTTRRS